MTVSLDWIKEHIAVLQIERPKVRNALNWAAMEAFERAVEEAHRLADLRTLIITGAETAFSSGGDLKELSTYRSEADGRRLAEGMTRALQRLVDLPAPTIAAINGAARGGGAEIALACDLRVMAENADLGMVHINIGISPAWGGGQRLMRLVGYSRAIEWLTTGYVLSASEALAHGLVNRLAPLGQSLNNALELAGRIASRPPNAVQAIKRLLQRGVTGPPADAEAEETEEFPSLWAAEKHHELVEMFLNRKRG